MKQNKIKAFTLIEVLVSLTIFSIITTSVIWIYITSSDIIVKSDINRKMQENLKNVSSQIAEDIRKNGISGISSSPTDTCDFNVGANNYKKGTKLCTKTSPANEYYLAKKDALTGLYIRVDSSSCSNIEDNCVIYNLSKGPLTNSFVSVKDLQFYLSKDFVPKLTMSILMQPSVKKGVKIDLIKESKITFQTTITERPF